MHIGPSVFKLVPYALAKPWGGGHLDALTGHTGEQHIGEYIVFSDLQQFPVYATVGETTRPLGDLWGELFPSDAGLPFMIKVLSTADPISLQNHPSDEDVKRLGLKGNGKFECWTILDADPRARMYLGLKEGVDFQMLRRLDADAQPMRHFNEYIPQRGDIVELFPGLVHSTVGKVLFYEIQQMSDYTFRIFDFGRGRELHLDEAIASMHEQVPRMRRMPEALETRSFKLRYHDHVAAESLTTAGEKFSVLTWFGAPAELSCGEARIALSWGDSALVCGRQKCTVVVTGATPAADLPMIDVLFEAFA